MRPRAKSFFACSLLLLTAALLALGIVGQFRGDDQTEKKSDKTLRVLFLGNSLTAMHNLPAMVQAMAATGGVRLECEAVTPGGVSLEDHWNGGQSRQKLASSKWDFVVLQQGPSSRPESQVNLKEYAMKWADDIRAHGATPALYMVWPYRGQANGFELVAQSYRKAAEASKSRLFPAGEAWAEALRDSGKIGLYIEDRLHPTLTGSYLAALVITRGLTDIKPESIPSKLNLADGQTVSIQDEQAKTLRRIAQKVTDKSASANSAPETKK